MSGEGLTKAQVKAVRWFAAVEYASRFGPNDPSLAMVRRLEKAGLVARCGSDQGRFGFVRYAITDLGRAALAGDPS